ncbi:MAG: RDD family protein [Microlunatus sp.]
MSAAWGSATPLPPGVQIGATGSRLLAALVEVGPVWLLTGLALLFGAGLEGRGLLAIVSCLLGLGWAVFVWSGRATKAAGLGMRLDSIQIVGCCDGRPIGWRRVLLRSLVFAVLTVTGIGLVAMLIAMGRHPNRQGWHDLAVDAVVIKELPPPPVIPASVSATAPVPVTASVSATFPAPAEPQSVVSGEATLVTPLVSPIPGEPSVLPVSVLLPATGIHPLAEAPASDHAWWLRLDDGRDIGIDDGLVLLGRNPQPRVGEEDALLLKVIDNGRTVSKSHLAIGLDARGLFVVDRGSTNGTTVTDPDGTQRACPPGDQIALIGGSIVSFGDHRLQVHRTRSS